MARIFLVIILAEIVSKNVDIRQYIALNYNFFSVMNIKSLEYLEILNYYKIFAKEDNGNTKKELTTFFEHLFHFLVRYVSNDLNQINSAKFKCRNLYSLFYYIKRCQEIQMAPSSSSNQHCWRSFREHHEHQPRQQSFRT